MNRFNHSIEMLSCAYAATLTATLFINHPRPGDLRIVLTPPVGDPISIVELGATLKYIWGYEHVMALEGREDAVEAMRERPSL